MESKNYFDVTITGEVNSTGGLREVTGPEAVETALKVWLTSGPYEFINAPSKGGPLAPYISKPLSDDNAKEIRRAISAGIYQEFQPEISVQSIEVTPLYSERAWHIAISGYCPLVQSPITISDLFLRVRS